MSSDDSARALTTLRKLALHDVSRWVLVGGLAVEFHCLRGGHSRQIRQLMQLMDADTSLRVDVFRADGKIMSRSISVDAPSGTRRIIQQKT